MDGQLKKQIEAQFEANQRTQAGLRYTVPSPDTYPYQWFWDSCFHAITLSYFDPERAKEELKLLLKGQFKNGMFPHIIYWQRIKNSPFPDIAWGKRHTSSITQPPVLAAAVWRIYEATGDKAFVRLMLPHIHAFHRYLFTSRDPKKLNLAGIINPDESGEDNSPRYDHVLGLSDPRHQFVDNFRARLELVDDWRQSRFVVKTPSDLKHWVYDVPFNCILAESLRLTSSLARIVDEPRIATWSHVKSTNVRQAIKNHLLRRHLYQPVFGPRLKPIPARTWALFMPLYAGVASADEAEYVVTNFLRNPREFGLAYSVPTVSISEPSFDPSGDWKGDWWVGTNWRGPVWMAPNWFIIQGLLRYGYRTDAERIYRNSLQLIKQSGMREYYDPLTGKGHGASGFTWAGLVLDMSELLQKPAKR
jgi:glycogen debranching enzyme